MKQAQAINTISMGRGQTANLREMNLTCWRRRHRYQLSHHLFQKTKIPLLSDATPATTNETLFFMHFIFCVSEQQQACNNLATIMMEA